MAFPSQGNTGCHGHGRPPGSQAVQNLSRQEHETLTGQTGTSRHKENPLANPTASGRAKPVRSRSLSARPFPGKGRALPEGAVRARQVHGPRGAAGFVPEGARLPPFPALFAGTGVPPPRVLQPGSRPPQRAPAPPADGSAAGRGTSPGPGPRQPFPRGPRREPLSRGRRRPHLRPSRSQPGDASASAAPPARPQPPASAAGPRPRRAAARPAPAPAPRPLPPPLPRTRLKLD